MASPHEGAMRRGSGVGTPLTLAFDVEPPEGSPSADEERLDALAQFYRTGRPAADLKPTRDGRLPAHLRPVMDLSAVRASFPAFLTGAQETPVRTLAEIVDTMVDSVESEGDDAERLKRDILKIERTIRQTVLDETSSTFGALWDDAVGLLFKGANGQDDRMKERRKAVKNLGIPLDASAPLLTCSEVSIERLAGAIHASTRASGSEALRADVDALRTTLLRILEVDDSHAPEKKDSEHLEASMGAGDIDAEALSGLLSSVPLDTRLPESRRRRIEDALRTLTEVGPHITGGPTTEATWPHLPERDVARSANEALKLAERNAKELVEFFRAFHTAKLEAENRYREEEHDDILDQYSILDLTVDEQRVQPPVFLMQEDAPVDPAHAPADTPAALLDLLAGAPPVRILRFRRRFGHSTETAAGVEADAGPGARTGAGPAPIAVNGLSDRLPVAALSAGSAFVLQTTASDLDSLTAGLSAGLSYPGPVLFDVYTGSADLCPELPAYLRSASARDARVVPSFLFDPGAGDDLASMFSVAGNPDAEKDWPSSRLPLEKDSDTDPAETAFTAIDFLACDERFDAHFARIPEDIRHEKLIAVADALDDSGAVPYVLLAGPDGRVHRYAVTRFLVDAAEAVRDSWRMIRELGGVRNSHVRARLDDEVARIEADKLAAIDELTTRHQGELDQATEAVAETVVSNLAARLLGLTSTRQSPESAGSHVLADTDDSGMSPLPSADPISPSSSATAPGQSAEGETSGNASGDSSDQAAPSPQETAAEEDAPLLTEEAYIDTPLCTTCNECTNLNGQIFAYDDNKQAYIKDASAGPFRDIVVAAEKCPVRIIHPGKPLNPDEPGLDELVQRAEPFNE